MLTQRFVGSGKKQEPYLFSITINTQASGAENGTTVQYPIRPVETLLSSSNTMAKVAPIIAEQVFKKYPITIDWGDNSVTKLNGDADAGIACGYRIASLETLQHTYAAHGVYTITVQCHKKSLPMGFDPHNRNRISSSYLGGFTDLRTKFPPYLVSIDSPLPLVYNVTSVYAGVTLIINTDRILYAFSNCNNLTAIPKDIFTANADKLTDMNGVFSDCTGLTAIPEGLLSTNTELTNVSGMFSACEGITRVPEKLFATNTQITDVSNLFSYCTKIQGSIILYSPVVKRITYMFDRTATAKTLFIPFHDETGAETTTYKTFKASTNPTYSTDKPNAQGVLLADLNSI